MTLISLAQLLGAITGDCADGRGRWTGEVPATWKQGRTAYGGLSTAIGHHVARMLGDDIPPLRSVQVAFIGPLAGTLDISAEILRQGRNTCFVEVRIASDDGLGFMGTYIFMRSRASVLVQPASAATNAPPLPDDSNVRSGPEQFFTCNMEYSDKRSQIGTQSGEMLVWNRLKDRAGLDPITEVLAIGDALPPAAMSLSSEHGPISSMNWQVNMLVEVPQTTNGWWLCESISHHSDHGASSQFMTMYDADCQPVLKGMQSVALFY